MLKKDLGRLFFSFHLFLETCYDCTSSCSFRWFLYQEILLHGFQNGILYNSILNTATYLVNTFSKLWLQMCPSTASVLWCTLSSSLLSSRIPISTSTTWYLFIMGPSEFPWKKCKNALLQWLLQVNYWLRFWDPAHATTSSYFTTCTWYHWKDMRL